MGDVNKTDLGRVLLQQRCLPGVPLTQHDVAAWWGCSPAYIYLLEQQALRKLRNRLLFMGDKRLAECLGTMIEARQAARPTERIAA